MFSTVIYVTTAIWILVSRSATRVCVWLYIEVPSVCNFSHLNRVANGIQVKTKCLIERWLSVMATHSGLLLYDPLLSCHIHHIKLYIQVYKYNRFISISRSSNQNLSQMTTLLDCSGIVSMCWGTFHYQVGGLEIWICRWCFCTAGSQEPAALLQSSSPSSMQPWSHLSSYLQSDRYIDR